MRSMKESTITRSSRSRQWSSRTAPHSSLICPGSRVIILPLIIALVVLSFPLSAQEKSPTDFIALVDVSESMFDRHEETVKRVLEEVVSEQLDSGDTFHLLSFGEEPEFEMSSRLTGEQSIETITSHLLLLKPLETSTDFTAAMKYLVEYVDGLSLSSKKRLLIITDGNNDPPPDSPYRDDRENQQRIKELSEYMKRNGWDVKILQFGDGGKEPGEESLITAVEESFEKKVVVRGEDDTTGEDVLQPAVEITFPEQRFQGRKEVTVPFGVTNPGEEGRTLRIAEVWHGDTNLLTEPRSITLTPGETRSLSLTLRVPEAVTTEERAVQVELVPSQGGPLSPKEGSLRMRRTSGVGGIFSSGSTILWIVLALIALALVFFLVRRLFAAASGTGEERRPASAAVTTGGKREESVPQEAFKEAAGRQRGGSSAADLLSDAGTREKGAVVPAYRSDREDTPLKKQDRSEGHEAASILSQASSQQEATRSAATGPSSEPESAEDVLKRSAQERKVRQRRTQHSLRAGLAAQRAGGRGVPFSSPRGTGPKALAELRKEGKLPIEMKVAFQRNTGGLNLLWFEEGVSKTVGAPGEADFAVTAIPVEGVIGHVVMEKGKLVFYTESRRYFPELEKPVRDCMKTPILVRSPETEEETTIRFQEYVHPLERINRIMHLVDKPGKPSFDY